MDEKENTVEPDALRNLLALHFDKRWGSAFWIEQAELLGFDPVRDVRSIADLERFPVFPLDMLATHPVEHFIPRSFHEDLKNFITSETGGTSGPPKRTAFREDEFRAAFVTPFLAAVDRIGFPRDVHWLFIGPSGPHIIGKAARACAVATGSIDPFAVDFDPRWARKLPGDSMARRRYVEHVLQQAEAVLRSQEIGVLFATPPILEALGKRLAEGIRNRIRGIHLGGMAADTAFWASLTTEWFPNAVAMSGYGNSLMGMCPQLRYAPGELPDYFPHGARLILDIVDSDETGRGRVRFHRLDESVFMPNVIERDEALSVLDPGYSPDMGFQERGIHDPRPARSAEQTEQGGLY